jgi:proteasome lid subunit RPN8/RPN11
MSPKLLISQKTWQAMRRHVSRCAPMEACGLLGGINERVEWSQGIPNVERSPQLFRMEPNAQWRSFQRMENSGLVMVGIYHSHPNGPNRPSPTDIAENMYPVAQIIWFRENGRWNARGYKIESGKAVEIILELRPSE